VALAHEDEIEHGEEDTQDREVGVQALLELRQGTAHGALLLRQGFVQDAITDKRVQRAEGRARSDVLPKGVEAQPSRPMLYSDNVSVERDSGYPS
jgi:hypothetical protein